MASNLACGLYLVTPVGLATGALALDDFLPLCNAALAAAEVEALLLRTGGLEAARDDGALKRQIEGLLPLAHGRGIPLILEERADLAATYGCDGVHLRADRQAVASVRRALGEAAVVGAAAGASRHDAIEAGEAGADYVTFGSFDPEPQPPDPELISWWQEMMQLPCVAMGGITLENAALFAEAGADFLALRNAVWNHPKGAAAGVKAFARLLGAL